MSNRKTIQTITIFVTLTVTGILLVVFPQSASNAAVRTTLPLIGAALFTSALTFFLIEMVRLQK